MIAADRERKLLDRYEQLVRIRRFEERTSELFLEGVIKGTAHSCIGQEAVAVGFGSALRSDDYLVGHHRSHGHVIAKGADITRMFAELMGRTDGYCKGLGGSMHIADLDLSILGCNGIVGAGTGLGCGSALASKLRGDDRVTVAFFGDGGINQGIVHETLNLASVWQLPIVFVCENNQFALTTPWQMARRVENIEQRANAYGIPHAAVDGNDFVATSELAEATIAKVRAGGGPAFIEARTYRRLGHSMRANYPDTRDMEAHKRWEELDPIVRFEAYLTENGLASLEELAAIRDRVHAEIEAAIKQAGTSRLATLEDAKAAVYAPHVREYPAPPDAGGRRISMIAALREAMAQEMARDEKVVVIGEDIAMGGIFTTTQGLADRFGVERVRSTPISEAAFMGSAVGLAMAGFRPIVEAQIFDFVTIMMDGIVNQAAKLRFMMGGRFSIPLVVRGPSGAGIKLAAQHSQSLEAWFVNVPGLVVVAPSNARDAKGLLAAAIRDDNPVIFLEAKSILFDETPCPEGEFAIPLGKAEIKREGTDVTVIATQAMVPQALRAAQELQREGISVEVVDPRTLFPLDVETLVASARKTSRVVVAHEAPLFGGIGGEIAARINEEAFFDLDAPVVRVGAPHVPIAYQEDVERATMQNWESIVTAIKGLP